MSRRYRSNGAGRERGFTVIEATVSLTLLLVVMVISMAFLFAMRNFSQRQENFTQPRQTARRAMEFLSFYVRGATDLNQMCDVPGVDCRNPNAIVTHWGWKVGGGVYTDKQACFNNVVDPNLADLGTDIFTVAAPNDAVRKIRFGTWNPCNGNPPSAANASIDYREGCPPPFGPMGGGSDALNMAMFMQMTGCYGGDCSGATVPCPGCTSEVLTIVDSVGNWTYYVITGYQSVNCSAVGDPHFQAVCDPMAYDVIFVTNNPGQSDGFNPPGGPDNLTRPIFIGAGITYVSFRVRNRTLEMKTGMFDPATDNPGAAFTPLLDNVEDLQVAYIFSDGTIWNTATQSFNPATGGVPTQCASLLPCWGGMAPPPATYDVRWVEGMRVNVVARSPRLHRTMVKGKARFYRPLDAEDHSYPAGTVDPANDRHYRYRMTSTLMLRNRIAGS